VIVIAAALVWTFYPVRSDASVNDIEAGDRVKVSPYKVAEYAIAISVDLQDFINITIG